jgi:NAD+ diphosphatase
VTFVPGITTTAARGRIFALAGPALHVHPGAPPALPVDEVTHDDLYLGELDGMACFARDVDPAPRAGAGHPPAETTPMPLRALFGAISDDEFGVAGRALGLTAWDRDHRFCGRCGFATERSATERVRACGGCRFAAYPRLSPAVIMLVERDGTCLLARNARTKMPFASTLAGFVEVGETLEHAVAREVREEAGIEIGDIRYFGSQPWPFTSSLMIGFTARWVRGEIVEDPAEIMDAAWYAPDALPVVPPKLSIARELIDDFVRRATA